MMKTTPQNVIMMVVTAADAMSGQIIALNVSARTPIQYVRTAEKRGTATDGRGGVGATDLGYKSGVKPHVNYVRLWTWWENYLQIVTKL